MSELADDLVYDYLKKNKDRFPTALASFEASEGKVNEGKCGDVKSGSRIERATKGKSSSYESKVEVMVEDFANRYGGSSSSDNQDKKQKSAATDKTSNSKATAAAMKQKRAPAPSSNGPAASAPTSKPIDPFGDPFGNDVNPFEYEFDDGKGNGEDAFKIDWDGHNAGGNEKGGGKGKGNALGDPGNEAFFEAVTSSLEEAQFKCPSVAGRLISIEDAKLVRHLFFGGKRGTTFNDAWREQGLFFSANKSAGFGLVQKQGGPCGVLASVQACIVRTLLFGKSGLPADWSRPSEDKLLDALVGGLVDIFMMAATGDSGAVRRPVVIALPRAVGEGEEAPAPRQTASYRPDGLTELLELHTLHNKNDVELFVRANLDQFTAPNGPGVVLLAVSTIFSRGLDNVKSDMDKMVEEPSLIGGHNYANQELVNLMLVGRAHSNIFDGHKDMDGLKLRGIPREPLVGFLTLFEHFGYVAAGNYYKNPSVPIWVICSESHYTVLFTMEKDLSAEQLEFYYYDELASQETLYHLTVRREVGAVVNRDDLVPPIDDVIRTRWKGALVDWNGSEPLL
jgi:hypothetical protein